MAGNDTTIKPFSQQPSAGPLKSTDLLLIAQPWAQGLEGYKTVNINIRTAYDTIINEFKTTGLSALADLDPNGGLIGNGTTADPLRVNQDWVNLNYAMGSLINISQVGNLSQTTLPIGDAATGFSYPVDGMSRMAFAMSTDSGFDTIVPATDGFSTTYNYGSGDLVSNGIAEYQPTEGKYMPRLPEGYNEGEYVVDQIFSCSKAYMVLKLRHLSENRMLDELAVVATHGTLNGAYHTTYFLTKNNLYVENLPSGSDVNRIESKMKYVAWEQGGKLYLSRFDIQPTDTSIGSDGKRDVGIVIYQLLSLGDRPERLTPLAVKGISSDLMGAVFSNTSSISLTGGYAWDAGSELDIAIVPNTNVEFIPLNLAEGSQSLDRFLDVFQYDENHVEFRLYRTANLYVRTATGSRQELVVNYEYNYVVDMVNKKIISKERSAKDYRPTLTDVNGFYTFNTGKQRRSLWDGLSGKIEYCTEDHFAMTTPVSTAGTSTVSTIDSETGSEISSAEITTTGSCCSSITADQISIPLGTDSSIGSQDLMFLSGDELTGYQVGGLKIQSEDTPTYSYVDIRGETIQGYSLELERFTEQKTINGINLSSYVANYYCGSGRIFNDLSGVYQTECKTRFGLLTFSLEDLFLTDFQTVTQHEVELVFNTNSSQQETLVTPVTTYVNYLELKNWIRRNHPILTKGVVRIIPFFDGSGEKVFVHLTSEGAIGIGPTTIHLIAECFRGDNDYTIGLVEEDSVLVSQQTYNGDLDVTFDQPDLQNATVFVEAETKKVAIFYGNFAEHTYRYPFANSRVYQYGFSSKPEVRSLPYSSNFGLVTYYLDKQNGISFTSKDSWLQILHTSEPVPFSDLSPMSAFASPMLLAAPALRSGYVAKILEPIPFFMSGINGFIPVQDISLEGIPLVNGVGTAYLYLGLVNGVAKVELRNAGTAERPDYTLIGVVTMNSSGLVSISAEPFIRLGNYRLSTRSKGSAIPVTAPRPDIQQFTLWD